MALADLVKAAGGRHALRQTRVDGANETYNSPVPRPSTTGGRRSPRTLLRAVVARLLERET